MPEFSVILPFYNEEKYLSEAVESVTKQTFTDFELILVDDGSTDNSAKLAETYKKKDTRIKLIKNFSNKGLGYSRNAGLKSACGKYIACIDADDYYDKSFLEKIYNVFPEYEVDSVWTKIKTYKNESGKETEKSIVHINKKMQEGIYEIPADELFLYMSYAWNKVYKRANIKFSGAMWAENLYFEDLYFYYIYFSLFPKFYLIDEKLYTYRLRQNSIINKCAAGEYRFEDIFSVIYKIYKFFKKNNTYDKYKESIKYEILNSIDSFIQEPACYERTITAVKELVNKIDDLNIKHSL